MALVSVILYPDSSPNFLSIIQLNLFTIFISFVCSVYSYYCAFMSMRMNYWLLLLCLYNSDNDNNSNDNHHNNNNYNNNKIASNNCFIHVDSSQLCSIVVFN